jgi:uncharacterized protein
VFHEVGSGADFRIAWGNVTILVSQRAGITMKLTKIERLLLVNQLLILEKLYPESAKAYKQERTALREGYELHYKDLFHLIEDETLSEDQCREVLDVLEMYRAITFSARRLPPTSKQHSHRSALGLPTNMTSDISE